MNFLTGMYYFFLGFKNINKKGLRRFVLIPIVFNLIIFSSIAYLGYHYLSPLANYYINQLPHWLGFLHSVFIILFFLLFVLFFLTTFSVFANLFAAPFNGLLAERAQNLLKGKPIPERAFGDMLVQSFKRQGQFIFYYIPRFIILCLLFLVPPIHPLLPFLWFFFNAWMLSMQYQDFAMDNNLIDFKTMYSMMKTNKSLSLGFGTMISFSGFIPFLNILSLPAAVIGGVFMLDAQRNN